MILDVDGRKATRNTETIFDPKLVVRLIELDDLLRQNGLGLFCSKCNRLGLPDGVRADNSEGSATYKLTCACATRVFHKTSGKERVLVS